MLVGYYKDKDVLLHQLKIAQDAFNIGMMNSFSKKQKGCLKTIDSVTMSIRSAETEQLALPFPHVPRWYWQDCEQQGLLTGGGSGTQLRRSKATWEQPPA